MIALTEKEKKLITEGKNLYFIDIPEELQEGMQKNGGYQIDTQIFNELNNFRDITIKHNTICGCGLKYDYRDYRQCPVCKNETFKKQRFNALEMAEAIRNKTESELTLKKKAFNASYIYEKVGLNHYKIYREKQLYTYNWLTDEFKIINEGTRSLIGDIVKTDTQFYVMKKNKMESIVLFAKSLSKTNTLKFIHVYNDLVKDRPLALLSVTGFELARMIMHEKIRITSEYFGGYVTLSNNYNDNTYKTASILDEIKQTGDIQFPIEQKTYNIYSATNLPKSVLKHVKQVVDENKEKDKPYFDYYVSNMLKLFRELIIDYKETANNAITLAKEFKYYSFYYSVPRFYEVIHQNHEFKHLFNYLKTIREKQGIEPLTALTYYQDYINASLQMGVPYTKYPKNLSKVHDVRMKDFNLIQDVLNENKFKESYASKTLNVTEVDNYVFLQPTEPRDLTVEGQALNHCVASYVNKVVDNNSLIYLMRRKEYPSISLVTIEYSLSKNAVVQARGKFNRNVTSEERIIIKKWAKVNKINY